ncbi:MAG: serine/threonine protein kinase [Phycisphaerae bacterium]|jgi:serine/threonine protein kinase/tetratricopeptide (TPR) repeat protein
MSSAERPNVEELFNAALERQTPQERSVFLAQHCPDGQVREHVQALLRAHDCASAFLESPAVDAQATMLSAGGEIVGAMIGAYKVLQRIGEGGFGAVYMAEQQHPVRRMVALKIIKAGMDTRQVIARFEAERQALAMMDHPHIARVLDAGATESGRPYFVMELVRGIRITEYCDSRKLDTRQRLELFMDVCHAVQHAHQKGIIHRDLKPSNILVTLHDSRAVPKVIDFGIAKATHQRLTDKTLFTEFRQLIGTPEYMSPDQADISGLDIDTRTDVYSLGVLLYELLTGTTPFDAKTLRTAPYDEIQRIIREEEPPVPSSRVHTIAGGARTPASRGGSSSAEAIAQQRSTDVAGLRRALRGDLDWIVMKSLEKDRTRRYQTAKELADDIQRFLDRVPVIAGPPGAAYKLRKFVQRHRLGVLASGLIVAALVAGLSLATLGFVHARRQALHSREVSAFLTELVTRHELDLRQPTLETSDVIRRAEELFGDDHALIGSMLLTRASSLIAAARNDDALRAIEAALRMFRSRSAPDQPSIAAAIAMQAQIHQEKGDLARAEELYREALDMKRRLYGERSKVTADALGSLTGLLLLYGSPQDPAEIERFWRETVRAYEAALGPDHPMTVRELCSFACWTLNNADPDESERLLSDAVERARRVLGMDDLARFKAINALAQVRWLKQGDARGTVPLIHELLDMAVRIFRQDSLVVASIRIQLVPLLAQAGDLDAAGRSLEEYLAVRERAAIQPNIVLVSLESTARDALRGWLREHPHLEKRLLDCMLRDAEATIDASEDYRDLLVDAAEWMAANGYKPDAEAAFRNALALQPADPKSAPQKRGDVLLALGELLLDADRAAEAEPLLAECVELRRASQPAGHWLIAEASSALGQAAAEQGAFERAEPLLLEANAVLQNHPESPAKRRREAVERLVRLYERWGRAEQAERWRARQPASRAAP